MSFVQNRRLQGGVFRDDHHLMTNYFSHNDHLRNDNDRNKNWNWNLKKNHARNLNYRHDFSRQSQEHGYPFHYAQPNGAPSMKRKKFSANIWEDCGGPNPRYGAALLNSNYVVPPPTRCDAEAFTTSTGKRDRSKLEEDEPVFLSRYEIERYSPSRKDGIDALRETHLRYSYCSFIQNLGIRLELPQTTIGTAMVLCHRYFVRRSHACHDRFLIATAALFFAAKSEETLRPLNDVLKASCQILHKQNITSLPYLLPADWFENYRERVIEAEQIILTTLNFELDVHHPYAPLTSILRKLGLSQTVLVNMALNLVSEGLRSSLWLQFKPHHIAAGAAYLAAKNLNFDLASCHNIWQEFETTPAILQDVAQQLMEL